MYSVEEITNELLNGEFGYKEVHFIEKEFLPGEGDQYIGFIYDVKGTFNGNNYEVSVFSHDGSTFEIRKDSDQGFDDLEGKFTL
ncbi:hypothetical protein [Domibacillus aminovorans]|uniref:Uncharacterized protein n=1 Tax=Domibacillus aminovorans TaxID=29332 RepID=A0A177LAD9_9BACI|nr:hypothetical protein [Domibacillus aminovorans]OAH62366.1 hypothetical protein AWH49_10420 [Domibacillus aminovorans]